MSRVLEWRCDQSGDLVFGCTDDNHRLPIGEWAKLPCLTPAGDTAMPGLLLATLDTPGVEIVDDGQGLKLRPERVVQTMVAIRRELPRVSSAPVLPR